MVIKHEHKLSKKGERSSELSKLHDWEADFRYEVDLYVLNSANQGVFLAGLGNRKTFQCNAVLASVDRSPFTTSNKSSIQTYSNDGVF